MTAVLVSALALAALSRAQAAAFEPTLLFNYTLDHNAGMLDWWEGSSTDTTKMNGTAWNVTYSDSPWSTYAPGQAGLGRSSRTSASGIVQMILRLECPATAVSVVGSGPPAGTVEPWIDTNRQSNVRPAAPWTASANAPWDMHAWTFSYGSGNWVFESVTVSTGMAQGNATRFEDVPNTVESFVNGSQLNPRITFGGQWKVDATIGGAGGQQPIQLPHATGLNQSWASIPIPRRTAFLVLNGTSGVQNGNVYFSWSPLPPLYKINKEGLLTTGTESARLNNAWEALSTLLILPLDPSEIYTLNITGQKGWNSGLHSLTYYSADGTLGTNNSTSGTEGGNSTSEGGHSTPAGGKSSTTAAVIGGAVGGVVGGLLLAGLALFCCLRRRKHRPVPGFVVDKDELYDATQDLHKPFLSPSLQPSQTSSRGYASAAMAPKASEAYNAQPDSPSSTQPTSALEREIKHGRAEHELDSGRVTVDSAGLPLAVTGASEHPRDKFGAGARLHRSPTTELERELKLGRAEHEQDAGRVPVVSSSSPEIDKPGQSSKQVPTTELERALKRSELPVPRTGRPLPAPPTTHAVEHEEDAGRAILPGRIPPDDTDAFGTLPGYGTTMATGQPRYDAPHSGHQI